MRKAFSETLIDAARKDSKIVFLTGDLGFEVFDEFRNLFGPRYINVGIAEAQLINTAVGLALEGWRPVAYSIAPFITARPYEQIRFGISYHRLPIMIVGAGGGFTYAKAGPTHHAPDDLALMASLPGVTIVTPGGPQELRELIPQMLSLSGPSYLRVGKFGEPDVLHESPIILGKARCLQKGSKVAIITAGDIVSDIDRAIKELQMEGFSPALFHFHTVKPVDLKSLDFIGSNFDTLLIIEESIPQGGLFHEACVWKAGSNSAIDIRRLGAPDEFILGNPSREELRVRIGIDGNRLKQLVKEIVKDTKNERFRFIDN